MCRPCNVQLYPALAMVVIYSDVASAMVSRVRAKVRACWRAAIYELTPH